PPSPGRPDRDPATAGRACHPRRTNYPASPSHREAVVRFDPRERTNFLTSVRKSAPYTLPSPSIVTPSARLDPLAYGYGHGSGIRYFTDPSRALPILMPRRAPGLKP